MKKLQSIIIFFINAQIIIAQFQDANWLFGYNDRLIAENCGKVIIHHDDHGLTHSFIETPLNFANTTASISTKDGNLLFYTNGCEIANYQHEIIINGSGLSPGEINEKVCDVYGYIVPRGALILPFSNSDSNKYVVLHLGAKYGSERSIIFDRLYYTIVDMSFNGGKGEVISKNNLLLEGDLESMAVVKHGNGRDWWIIVPEFGSNRYHRILFSDGEYSQKEDMISGFDFPKEFCETNGNSVFSPDGSYFIRSSSSCGFITFKFDRCSGVLSTPIYNPLNKTLGSPGSDAVISTSNMLFLISPYNIIINDKYYKDRILKFDLQKIGVSTKYVEYLFPNTFEQFDIKPQYFIQYSNGEIFFYSLKNKGTIYKIDKPDSKNEIIEFKPIIALPAANALSVPYFPNYKLKALNNSLCDTLTNTYTLHDSDLNIFPNPAHNNISILLSGFYLNNSQIKIFSIHGELLKTYEIKNDQSILTIDLMSYPQGTYLLNFKNEIHSFIYKFIKI